MNIRVRDTVRTMHWACLSLLIAGLCAGCGTSDEPATTRQSDTAASVDTAASDDVTDAGQPSDPGSSSDPGAAVDIGPDLQPELPAPCDPSACPQPDDPCLEAGCDADGSCAEVPRVEVDGVEAACQTDPCLEPGVCAEGQCSQELPISCSDGDACTADACEAGVGCVHQASEGTCDDGDPCSVGDFCGSSGCQGGQPLLCDDELECTVDSCQPGVGCVAQAEGGGCIIDEVCVAPGQRKGIFGGDACLMCQPAKAAHTWTYAPGGYLCGTQGSCSGLDWEVQQVCGPGTGQCVPDVALDCSGSDPCLAYSCDPNDGCQAVPVDDGTPCGASACMDGVFITGSACQAGVCLALPVQDCTALATSCRMAGCTPTGCDVADLPAGTACQSGPSGECASGEWHALDQCNGSGLCVDGPSTDCVAAASVCETGSCSNAGCLIEPLAQGSACGPKACADSCTAAPAKVCDGEGSCLLDGSNQDCGGGHCLTGECVDSCTGNAQCCDNGGDRTCLGGQCAERQACSGECDPNDLLDCQPGLACVDCDTQGCVAVLSGWRCMATFSVSGWTCPI